MVDQMPPMPGYGVRRRNIPLRSCGPLSRQGSTMVDREWGSSRPGGPLVAVLLNPPSVSGGARTRNAVTTAARVLGYESADIVNLCLTKTASVVELNSTSVAAAGWSSARYDLAQAVRGAGAILGAWGMSGMVGAARKARDDQVTWLREEAMRCGLNEIWMVGGEPRHPSRWHQFVSDRHGRTIGGSFEERLGQLLVVCPMPITTASTRGSGRAP